MFEKIKRMYLKKLIGFWMVLTVGPLFGQGTWTLEKCIQYGLRNNLNYQGYVLSEKDVKIDHRQAKLNLLPSVSASSWGGINYGRTADPNTNDMIDTEYFSSSMSLDAGMTLFAGFRLQNRIAWSRFRLEAAKWQKVNEEDDLAFNILMAAYDVIYYQEMIVIAREQLALSEISLKKIDVQVETGIKAKTDLAEIQATYEKDKLALLRAENKLEEMKLTLAQLMNLPAGQLDSLRNETGEPNLSAGLASDSLFASFVALSPYVKIAEANLEAAAKELAIARGQYVPSLSFSASVSTGYYETNEDETGSVISFRDQIDNNQSQTIGASLSIPIFGNNEVRNGVQKAKLAREQAKLELEQYRQTVYFELQNNFREWKALFQEYYQVGRQVEADRLAYQAAERKYDEGLIDVIELLTVKNRLAEAQSELLSSRLQWEIKDKTMEFYKGNRFWAGNDPGTKDAE